MLESSIQAAITRRLKSSGWWVTKLIQTSTNGIPDLLCIREGRVVFIEVKRPGQHPRPMQEHRMKQLQAAGVEVMVARSIEDITNLL